MANMLFTADQVSNIAYQYIAAHGITEWQAMFYDGTHLVVPSHLVTKVQALDPDKRPVPEAVTMMQARVALIEAGLIDQVETALAADTSQQGKVNAARWEYATEVRRNSDLVAGIGSMLGLTEAEKDALFISAAAVE